MLDFLPLIVLGGILAISFLYSLAKSIRIVPAQEVQMVERLGKYSRSLGAGIHILIPFFDKVSNIRSLKEQAIDVPTQSCFTLDNVRVEVDGVLYLKVVEPYRASYGVINHIQAAVELAQTTMRSVIGKLELDKTFEERDQINGSIVQTLDEAAEPWGLKVTRYEIKNIEVPATIINAMEVQMRAEREKRAEIARSLGESESKINRSLAKMEELINHSEGEKQRLINEAEGRAAEILAVAKATAEGIRHIALALEEDGGDQALLLQISEQYVLALKGVGRPGTKVMLPMDLTDPSAFYKQFESYLHE